MVKVVVMRLMGIIVVELKLKLPRHRMNLISPSEGERPGLQ